MTGFLASRPFAREYVIGGLPAQARREWSPSPETPADLSEQTLVVVGLGSIGSEIARLGQSLGLLIGVRRSPRRSADPVDEFVPPTRLSEVLPRGARQRPSPRLVV